MVGAGLVPVMRWNTVLQTLEGITCRTGSRQMTVRNRPVAASLSAEVPGRTGTGLEALISDAVCRPCGHQLETRKLAWVWLAVGRRWNTSKKHDKTR